MTVQPANIGALSRRLTLEAPVETPDGAGGVAREFTAVATMWAEVMPLSARVENAADSVSAALRYRIVVRKRDKITTRHRFREAARIYRIIAVREGLPGRFLEIDAEAREDSPP
ncbi:MAG TPA: phage head closure protein [Pseudolabrys sp.]